MHHLTNDEIKAAEILEGFHACPDCGTTVVETDDKRFPNGIRPASAAGDCCEFCGPVVEESD